MTVRRAAGLALVAALSGCGNAATPAGWQEPVRLPLLEEMLTPSSSDHGAESGTDAISRIVAARIRRGTDSVVVLDLDPPHLRIFDRSGLAGEAVGRGGGPGEIRGAGSLALFGDSAFLVGPNSLVVVDLDGAEIQRVTPAFPLLDLGSDCDGRMVLYGPAGDAETAYIHAMESLQPLTLGSSDLVQPAPGRASWGHGRSVVIGNAAGSVVSHRTPDGAEIVFYGCDGALRDRPWSWAVESRRGSDAAAPPARRDSITVMSADLTNPRARGAAELSDGALLQLRGRLAPMRPRPSEPGDMEERTYFEVADARGIRRGYVSGTWALQDAADGKVLLSSSDPWPRVVVLTEDDLRRLMADGDWIRRE